MLNFVRFLRMLIVVLIGLFGCLGTVPALACTNDEITLSNDNCVPAKFSILINIAKKNSNFSFYLAATGTFYVDWGDGTVETINSTSLTRAQRSHRYKSAGDFTVRLGGWQLGTVL